MDFLRSEFEKWGEPLGQMYLRQYPGLPAMDQTTRRLYERLLPRGVLLSRLQQDRERVNYWMSPGELITTHRYQPGQLLIGKMGSSFLGHLDDRPMVTIAGARAGKSTTNIKPNLYLYPGSVVAIDPKEEHAGTAPFRRAMGHEVHVLRPFSCEQSASFNPLAELDPRNPRVVDDVMSLTYALVPETDGGGNAKHFSDSARTLLFGLILLTLTLPEADRHLVTVRELLCLTYKPLANAARIAAAKKLAEAPPEAKKEYFDAHRFALRILLNRLVALGDRFGGTAAAVGSRMLETPQTERGGIFSTAAVHTDFLDSLLLRKTLRRSDFNLADLRGDGPVTIFLCLPVGRMERHAPWLRMIIQLALTVLERFGEYPRNKPPILFLLDEFATLGRVRYLERSAAYFPSFGIKPWYILQNISQLKENYRSVWESFLGNAGLIQLFANGDQETIEYVARRLGKLAASFELQMAFAREHSSQLLLMQGKPAAAALRLEHHDVDLIRGRAEAVMRRRALTIN